MFRWLFFIAIYFLLGFYMLQALKTATKLQWVYYFVAGVSILVLANFIYQWTFGASEGRVLSRPMSYAAGLLLAVMAFKLVSIIFLFSEDIFRFLSAAYQKISGVSNEFNLPSRRRFLSIMALGIAALPFGALLYGMYKGKYNFKVLKYDLTFDDLPNEFDGYQITQISDIHSGSFDNHQKIAYAIDLINQQKSDVLFFTGDMVNNKASEMKPWAKLFAKLEANDGKYSILGNHDYGDYVDWPSPQEKAQNLEDLKNLQKEIGFDLILNDSRYLEKNGAKIALIGVENWGRGGFKKAGDLKKAVSKINSDDFKILLSHDPSHWEDVVVEDDLHYHLTLSGHTHGMQFGIEIPGWIKWSPVKWRYKYWAGIYEQMGQYINVNRGFGFLGYPGRVGIWPEITVITLKRNSLT
ncbi:metallophosphoesterase [Kriegella sp. EG-1]|nr:metallophosphoesterase [Flavobacteriaceae bacterium EG-1]